MEALLEIYIFGDESHSRSKKEKTMKPILVVAKEINNDLITLYKSELDKLIDRAYEAGRSDGYESGKRAGSWTYVSTASPNPNPNPKINSVPLYNTYPQITCDDHIDIDYVTKCSST